MQIRENESLELSFVMPCLNEEHTVGGSIREAKEFLERNQIRGEILVVDNGSADASASVATAHGAKVITQPRRGYGIAIRTGIAASRGKVIIIGDCDSTYDFLNVDAMYRMLVENACDMAIGNRFAGGIERGSMPLSHKWGVRFLSQVGRWCLGTDVYDFHCGLRGLTRSAAEELEFCTDGMEFATEMIAEAAKNNLRIIQLPVVLRRCSHPRKSKLRTIRDGMRHLIYMLQTHFKRGRISWEMK